MSLATADLHLQYFNIKTSELYKTGKLSLGKYEAVHGCPAFVFLALVF
jgi:hypothetical protein